jgi:hypothetical protein
MSWVIMMDHILNEGDDVNSEHVVEIRKNKHITSYNKGNLNGIEYVVIPLHFLNKRLSLLGSVWGRRGTVFGEESFGDKEGVSCFGIEEDPGGGDDGVVVGKVTEVFPYIDGSSSLIDDHSPVDKGSMKFTGDGDGGGACPCTSDLFFHLAWFQPTNGGGELR